MQFFVTVASCFYFTFDRSVLCEGAQRLSVTRGGTLLPHERAQTLRRTAQNVESGADLPLALLHLSRLLAALLDRSRPGLMSDAKIRTRRARLSLLADADAALLRRRQSDFQVQLREIGAWSPRRERHSAAGHAQARTNPRVLKVNYFYPTTLWRAWTECAPRHESSSFPRAHRRSRRAQ